jgi:hypothetical protein
VNRVRRHAGGQWGSRAGGFPENIENPSKVLHADAPQWGAADSIAPRTPPNPSLEACSLKGRKEKTCQNITKILDF